MSKDTIKAMTILIITPVILNILLIGLPNSLREDRIEARLDALQAVPVATPSAVITAVPVATPSAVIPSPTIKYYLKPTLPSTK